MIVKTSRYLREPSFEALVDSRYQLDRGGAKHAATPTLSSNPHPLHRQLPPARATQQCSANFIIRSCCTWHKLFFNCENKSEVSNETKYNLLAFLWTWKFEPNGKLGLLLFIQVYFSGMWQSTLFPPQGHTSLANQHCVHRLIIEHYHCTALIPTTRTILKTN